MNQLSIGILLIIFGLFIGGAGIATAGIGIGIPMIPIGIYLFIRGFRCFAHDSQMKNQEHYIKQKSFESTGLGKFGLGVIFILVGIATSALLIGIPIFIIGVFLIFRSFRATK